MRNVRIGARRTSVRLEAELWDALQQICDETGRTVHEVCTEVARQRQHSLQAGGAPGSFASCLRVFILQYFRWSPRGDQAAGPYDPA